MANVLQAEWCKTYAGPVLFQKPEKFFKLETEVSVFKRSKIFYETLCSVTFFTKHFMIVSLHYTQLSVAMPWLRTKVLSMNTHTYTFVLLIRNMWEKIHKENSVSKFNLKTLWKRINGSGYLQILTLMNDLYLSYLLPWPSRSLNIKFLSCLVQKLWPRWKLQTERSEDR